MVVVHGVCFGPGSGPGGHPLAYVVLPPAAVREEHVGSQRAPCRGLWLPVAWWK